LVDVVGGGLFGAVALDYATSKARRG